ncbi:MAG TPA: twin transmembrane helix small protein [Alphaproteobacteria bacterium]|jgi:cytochrome b subunit of formate dehydrogenase|nr:twin transmembrane helix small protein [Alphaproteobacteria bacterium]
MIDVIKTVIYVLLGLVVLVLVSGVVSMFKGGAFNARWGNRLMRYRVALQAFAVVLIVVLFLIER